MRQKQLVKAFNQHETKQGRVVTGGHGKALKRRNANGLTKILEVEAVAKVAGANRCR